MWEIVTSNTAVNKNRKGNLPNRKFIGKKMKKIKPYLSLCLICSLFIMSSMIERVGALTTHISQK